MAFTGSVVVAIGDIPVCLRATDRSLVDMLERRYAKFLSPDAPATFHFDLSIVPPRALDGDRDLTVGAHDGRWRLERGDFRAEWDSHTRRGWIEQTLNPYAADSVLRIVHTLILSEQGGFLLHASSAVRAGRAFLFTGPSGAGKTTIARLAPADVTLLTDEISYVRSTGAGYVAFGTPFAGDLGEAGEPISAPVAAIYRLARGDNEIERLGTGAAVRTLMRNLLFFSEDYNLTTQVFHSACRCAADVPMYRLAFAPDARVWELIS